MESDSEHGEDSEAGDDPASYKAALESWLHQAVGFLELRAEYTTVDGLKAAGIRK